MGSLIRLAIALLWLACYFSGYLRDNVFPLVYD